MTLYQGLDHQGEIPRITDPQPRYQRIYDELDHHFVLIQTLLNQVDLIQNKILLIANAFDNLDQQFERIQGTAPTPYQSSDRQELQVRLDKSIEK